MNTLHYYYTSPRYTSLRFASRFTKLHHASFALRTLESTLTNSTNWCLCSKVQNRGRELHHLRPVQHRVRLVRGLNTLPPALGRPDKIVDSGCCCCGAR